MSFLGPKPFRGTTIRDVLQYLQVEATKSFADLYAILGKIKLEERYVENGVTEMVDCAASAAREDITQLTLDAGTWNVYGSAQFHNNGATGTTYAQVWISTESTSVTGTYYGQSRTEVAMSNVSPWFQATCFRRITLAQRRTLYLGTLAVYTGGPIRRLGSIWAIGRG